MSTTHVTSQPTQQQAPQKAKVEPTQPEVSQMEYDQTVVQAQRNAGSPLSGDLPPSAIWSRLGPLQAKFTVGPADDGFEREADSVADQVVQRMAQTPAVPLSQETATPTTPKAPPIAPLPSLSVMGRVPTISARPATVQTKCTACAHMETEQSKEEPDDAHGAHVQRFAAAAGDDAPRDADTTKPTLLQRKCSQCEAQDQEEHGTVHAKRNQGFGPSTTMLSTQLASTKGQGMGLPHKERQQLETAFGADFSKVKIHTESAAAELARSIHAQAFTHGADIYFDRGKYQPHTPEGMRLLAHELTHTVQQGAVSADSSLISRQVDEDSLQRTCDNLAAEFDLKHMSKLDRARLDARVKECTWSIVHQGLQWEQLMPMPEFALVPSKDETSESATYNKGLRDNYQREVKANNAPPDASMRHEKMMKTLLASLGNWDGIKTDNDKALEKRKEAKLSLLEAWFSQFGVHKTFSWAVISNTHFQKNLEFLEHAGNPKLPTSDQGIAWYQSEASMIQADPVGWVWKSMVSDLYKKLGAEMPFAKANSTLKQIQSGKIKATLEQFPSEIIGPDSQVPGSIGTFTMRLDYSLASDDVLAQIATKWQGVEYHWELIDMTESYGAALEEDVKKNDKAIQQDTKSKAATTPSDAPSGPQKVLKDLTESSPSQLNEVSISAARKQRNIEIDENYWRDHDANQEVLRNPGANTDDDYYYTKVNRFYANWNNITEGVGVRGAKIVQMVYSIGDILGGTYNEREIPFPRPDRIPPKGGWYLVRCIAAPLPIGKGTAQIVRQPSVAIKIVRLRPMVEYAKERLHDLDDNFQAHKIEINTQLAIYGTNDNSPEVKKLKAQLEMVEKEMTGSAQDIIGLRMDKLALEIERTSNSYQKTKLQLQLDGLRNTLTMASIRSRDYLDEKKIIRPRAMFISQETSEAYPLLLQLGAAKISLKSSSTPNKPVYRYRYLLSDVTSQGSTTYEGEADNEITAIERAFQEYANDCPYGRGLLVVGLPNGNALDMPEKTYKCDPLGVGQAKANIGHLLTLLAVLGMIGVPYLGQVAMVGGAILATARIKQRIDDHTMDWDVAAVTDLMTILGVVASGVLVVGKLRLLKAGNMFALAAEHEEVALLLDSMRKANSVVELADKALNLGGYIIGTADSLVTIIDISNQEMTGAISHAEARRKRAMAIADALKSTAMQFAHYARPLAKIVAGELGITLQNNSNKPSEKTVRLPSPKFDGITLGKKIIAATGRFSKEKYPGLHSLLSRDHELLADISDKKIILDHNNVKDWNEIGRLGSMEPETYAVLLAKPELRKALLEHTGAADMLKHCNSPCFPPNATAADVIALDKVLKEYSKTKVLDATDFQKLNDYLYAHRASASLGDVIAALGKDFEGTLARAKDQSNAMPAEWGDGKSTPPGLLPEIQKQWNKLGLSNQMAAEVFKNLGAIVEAENTAIIKDHLDEKEKRINSNIGEKMLSLKRLLTSRGEATDTTAHDRLLHGLQDPATASTAVALLKPMRKEYQGAKTSKIVERLSIKDIDTLHKSGMDITLPETIDHLHTIVTQTDVDSAKAVADLVNNAGYPAPAEGATNPDMRRLLEIIGRSQETGAMSISKVKEAIANANKLHDEVSRGSIQLNFKAAEVGIGSGKDGLRGGLLTYLHKVMLQSDVSKAIVEKYGDAKLGESIATGRPDFSSFAEITAAMRTEFIAFLKGPLRIRVEGDGASGKAATMSDAELNKRIDTLVNTTFAAKRGDFFEAIAKRALTKYFEAELKAGRVADGTKVMGEFSLGVIVPGQTTTAKTFPDVTVLIQQPAELKVVFFELKTGINEVSKGQTELRTLVQSKDPDKIGQMKFVSPEAKAVAAEIAKAHQQKKTILFDYRMAEENPKH